MKARKAKGVTVSFRPVEESDAEFILSLRLDPDLGRYMSPTDPSVEKQREWIAEYKKREAAGEECYYIVRNSGRNCGTVRMFPAGKCFEWGSFILNGDTAPSAAIETAMFVYQTAFDLLNFEKSLFIVNKENIRAITFHRRTGARIIGERETSVGKEHLFEVNREDWKRMRKKFGNFLVKTFE